MSADKMKTQLDQVPNTEKHGQHFSEDSFWDKVKDFASNVGAQGIYYALILYYTLMDDETPMSQKGIIIGALGYFILPFDLIPDFIPVAGYTDDIAAITAALKAIWVSVKPTHLALATHKTKQWFPNFIPPTINF
jgi:uncharacterized membrane protein YkvA (DUF1232 family)